MISMGVQRHVPLETIVNSSTSIRNINHAMSSATSVYFGIKINLKIPRTTSTIMASRSAILLAISKAEMQLLAQQLLDLRHRPLPILLPRLHLLVRLLLLLRVEAPSAQSRAQVQWPRAVLQSQALHLADITLSGQDSHPQQIVLDTSIPM